MKRRRIGWIASIVGLLLLGGLASGALAAPAKQSGPMVQTANNPTMGTILVNNAGFTLYTLSSEAGGHVTCTGACASAWPPLVLPAGTTTPTVAAGVTGIGTVMRPDGSLQVTFNGFPLYMFSGDSAPGQTNGEGIVSFGGTWHVARVSAAASATATPTSTSSGTSAPLVQVVNNATLGPILVNAQGMTLYFNSAEHGTTFVCKAACLGVWPPLLLPSGMSAPTAGPGIPGTLAVVTRPEGSQQVTYNGEPLYAFAKDTAPGDIKGEGIVALGGVWHAARANNTPLAAALAVPLRVKITTSGSTVWGKVTARFTLGGTQYARSCASASCSFAVPAGVTLHLSQTPRDRSTWPFKQWRAVAAGAHHARLAGTRSLQLTLRRGTTVTAIYVPA